MASYHISSGVISTGIYLDIADYMYIASGGVANSTTVNSGGSMRISAGGTATAIRENGGYVYVADGANVTFVSNTITGLNLSDRMTVHSNTVANSTTVNSRGSMYISSGGIATAIRENGGYVYVADGANVTFAPNTITGLTLSRNSMTVHSNTVANSTTVNSSGRMYISSGGVANSTTVNGDFFGGYLYISSGGVANSTTVNGGGMFICSGGVANSTTLISGGSMYISSGGVANILFLHL